MRRAAGSLALALVLSASPLAASSVVDPADRDTVAPLETNRSSTMRALYFPFLAIGHGLFFLVKYGVGYPVYYVFKPGVDFMYSSPQDPAEYPGSVPPSQPPPR